MVFIISLAYIHFKFHTGECNASNYKCILNFITVSLKQTDAKTLHIIAFKKNSYCRKKFTRALLQS